LKLVENNITGKAWHTYDINEVVNSLQTNVSTGLSEPQAHQRLTETGLNELEEKKGRSPFKIFISQFNDFMIWILIAAALISGVIIREITDAIVILVILVINSVLGFVQEYRAEKALQALKELAAPSALILRDGTEKHISSKLLVPGDVIKLAGGDLVPADCRIVSSVNLQTDESIITGESMAVEKSTEPIAKATIALGDRLNILFSGTTVVKGRCTAIVVATGKNTEIGKIASLVQEKEDLTPLQKELKTVGARIGIICLAVSAIVFAAGVLKGFSVISQGLSTATRGDIISQMLLVAVALAVASIPEGLPAIVTISLALGVQKMAKNNAIVRRLSSVETLGSVSVICTDKTGTLTQNKMVVRKIFPGLAEFEDYEKQRKSLGLADKSVPAESIEKNIPRDNLGLRFLIENAVLCNDAYYLDKNTSKIAGDPTEAALIELGNFYSIDKKSLEFILPREYEEPFDSVRKMMTTVHKVSDEVFFTAEHKNIIEKCISGSCENNLDNNTAAKNGIPAGMSAGMGLPGYIVFTKGAPEALLSKCSMIIKENSVEDLSKEDLEKISHINTELANNAMRNLAFAFKYITGVPDKKNIALLENDLVFSGLVGMIDPPRPEAFDAVKKCRNANINIIMVTGDHKLTAKAIGRELGILGEQDRLVDEEELSAISSEDLVRDIEDIKVFARVSPENKVEIVEALKQNNHIVAMTGDGINDAPSLKKADIGVAMGITGTDVSKEASDMILTDDNFATIVKAIKEGRVIYDNLKKFILFLLSCNISEVLLMFVAIVFGSFIFSLIGLDPMLAYIPLLPVQILWMNLITDGLPALALGINPAEPNIMDRKATKRKERILSKKGLTQIFWQGLILTLGALLMYFIAPLFFDTHNLVHDTDIFHTCVFTTLVITQLLHSYNFRFEDKGILRKGIFANKILNISVAVSILLQVGLIYVPFLQKVFSTTSLDISHWIAIILCSIIPVLIINLVDEIIIKRRKKLAEVNNG